MFSILNRALSWAITSIGNKFCLNKRPRLIKASDNRFYDKFIQLEIGLLSVIVCFSKLCYQMFDLFFIFSALFLRTESRG